MCFDRINQAFGSTVARSALRLRALAGDHDRVRGAAHFEVGVSEEWLSERAVMNILDKLGADNGVDPELLGMLHRLAAEATRDRVRSGKDQLLLEAA